MNATPPNATAETTRYRVVVRSASEAVSLVRERFGEAARVLSVRQIEAGGLARFLQKPRLEVIVEIGAPAPRLSETSAETAAPDHEVETAVSSEEAESSDSAKELREPRSFAREQISALRATGLDESLLERVRADHPGLDWDRTPAPEALVRLAAWLRRQFDSIPRKACESRRVFIGPCGAGKTSALCKMLALDVFVHGRKPAVLKLDGELPNATDGLAAFCEVMGAPLLRSAAEVGEFDEETPLYVDIPGIALDAHAEQRRLAQTLDALRVETRILVVNAAWESEVIAAAFEMGRACGATHVFFTHTDEVRRPAKLWRFVLCGGLRTLAFGSGPSPAGEIEENVFSALLSRTVPPAVARAAGSEGGRP